MPDFHTLPPPLAEKLSHLAPANLSQTIPLTGGDINQAARIVLADGQQWVVKWRHPTIPTMFSVEQRGLALLQATNTVRVLKLIAHAEGTEDCPAFIVMEWLGQGRKSAEVETRLGQQLALLHQQPILPQFGGTNDDDHRYGLDHDNFIGATPQPNRMGGSWVSFFREERLGFQMELAGQNGYLPKQRRQLLARLLTQLAEYLPDQPESSLLHGDLWGGNWLVTDDGEPALIDPAVYYGHREADLAFTELFGGFSAQFYAAYNETWPLDHGYPQRKPLYNLYHLLNHLNLFGEGYGSQVDAVLRRYG